MLTKLSVATFATTLLLGAASPVASAGFLSFGYGHGPHHFGFKHHLGPGYGHGHRGHGHRPGHLGWSHRGYGHKGYGYKGYGHKGYGHKGHGNDAAYLFGGLLLGALLYDAFSYPRHHGYRPHRRHHGYHSGRGDDVATVYRAVPAPTAGRRVRPALPAHDLRGYPRRLWRDVDGTCYLIGPDGEGREVRSIQPSSEC